MGMKEGVANDPFERGSVCRRHRSRTRACLPMILNAFRERRVTGPLWRELIFVSVRQSVNGTVMAARMPFGITRRSLLDILTIIVVGNGCSFPFLCHVLWLALLHDWKLSVFFIYHFFLYISPAFLFPPPTPLFTCV